jgi:phosphoglycolate phosphatase-like HAD superfamily hydrolase
MKLVIFDIDGTLVNSTNADDVCFFETFEEIHNIIIKNEEFTKYKQLTTGTDLELFRYIFNEFFTAPAKLTDTIEFKDYFYSELKKQYENNPKLFKEIGGAKDFIESLMKNTDVNIAIATGSWSDSALLKLKAIGLDTYSFPISTSDVYSNRKDIVLNAMTLAEEFYSSEGYEKIYYIGDAEWDFKAAQALNIEFIGVDHHNSKALSRLGVDKIIKNFKGDKALEYLGIK